MITFASNFVEKIANKSTHVSARIFGLLPVSTISENKAHLHQPKLGNENKSYQNTKSIQKTSITVNNEDCSSTVKVTDAVRLFHSSVIIKNEADFYDRKEEVNVDVATREHKYVSTSGDRTSNVSIIHHNDRSSNSVQNANDSQVSTANLNKALIYLNYADISQNTHITSYENDFERSLSLLNNIRSTTSIGDSFVLKLLNDPNLSRLLYGLEIKTIANIIENSLIRLRANKQFLNAETTKDIYMDEVFSKQLNDVIKEERNKVVVKEFERQKNNHAPKAVEFISNSMHVTRDEVVKQDKTNDVARHIAAEKIDVKPEDLVVWKIADISISEVGQNGHQYESISTNRDPIYEEINEKPPPLPTNPPPAIKSTTDKCYKPMFSGASKYDILSYLVDAKERIIIPEDLYTFKFERHSTYDNATLKSLRDGKPDFGLKMDTSERCITSIERNDSGVGSETSKTSRTKYQPAVIENKTIPPIHLCEDCGKWN